MKTQMFINAKTGVKAALPVVGPGLFLLNGRKWDVASLRHIGIYESPRPQPAEIRYTPGFGNAAKFSGKFVNSFRSKKQPRA